MHHSSIVAKMIKSWVYIAPIVLVVVDGTGCSLCGGEKTPGTPNLQFGYANEILSCAEIDERARLIEDSDECHQFTMLTGFDVMCRCYDQANECHLCAGGGDPGDQILSQECLEIYRYLPYSEEGSEACNRAQQDAFSSCGCAQTPPMLDDPCSLCADGSQPPRLDVQVDQTTMCSDLVSDASVVSNASQACYSLQLIGKQSCGCQAELPTCPLCADGSQTLLPDNMIDENTTCGDIDGIVSPHSAICPTIQTMGYFQCGCPIPPTIHNGPCTLCAGGEIYHQDNIFGDRDFSCRDTEINIYSSGKSSDVCTYHQAGAVLHCGCDTLPPDPQSPTCTLCPGGADPLFPESRIPWMNNVTCGTYNKLIPHMLDGSSCYLAEEERAHCGCPSSVKCSLCRSGEKIVNATKSIDGTLGTYLCADLEQAATYIQLTSDRDDFEKTCINFRQEYAPGCCPSSEVASLFVGDPTKPPTEAPSTTPSITPPDTLSPVHTSSPSAVSTTTQPSLQPIETTTSSPSQPSSLKPSSPPPPQNPSSKMPVDRLGSNDDPGIILIGSNGDEIIIGGETDGIQDDSEPTTIILPTSSSRDASPLFAVVSFLFLVYHAI